MIDKSPLPSFTHRNIDIHVGRNLKDHLFVPPRFVDVKVGPQRITYFGPVYPANDCHNGSQILICCF